MLHPGGSQRVVNGTCGFKEREISIQIIEMDHGFIKVIVEREVREDTRVGIQFNTDVRNTSILPSYWLG